MAAITVTARSVKPMPGTIRRDFVAGGSGNVGDAVYIDSNGKVQQANASAAGTAIAIGIVVSAGSLGALTFASGDAVSVVLLGVVGGFSSLTPGSLVYLSDTAGGFDTAAGTVSKKVGVAVSADKVLFALAV